MIDYYLYDSLEECLENEKHLKSCDDDGYCNACGHQTPYAYDEEFDDEDIDDEL